ERVRAATDRAGGGGVRRRAGGTTRPHARTPAGGAQRATRSPHAAAQRHRRLGAARPEPATPAAPTGRSRRDLAGEQDGAVAGTERLARTGHGLGPPRGRLGGARSGRGTISWQR